MHMNPIKIAACIIVLATAAAAQEQTRAPIADTYVESTMPDTNFGTSEELAADGLGSVA